MSCLLCQNPVEEGQQFVRLPDGRECHSDCWKCARCAKPLGKYKQKDGAYYCAECVADDPDIFCDVCKREIEPGQSYKQIQDGRTIHRACWTPLSCKICQKEIDGQENYNTLPDGRDVHKACWRCADCGLYLVDYYTKQGRPYCPPCYRAGL